MNKTGQGTDSGETYAADFAAGSYTETAVLNLSDRSQLISDASRPWKRHRNDGCNEERAVLNALF